MIRERWISVPKDKAAMQAYDYGIEREEQMERMILSEEQYKLLYDTSVFKKINNRCDIIIDDYEDEILELDKIPIALEIVEELIDSSANEELIRLKNLLEMALAYKTCVGFDF